MYGKTVTTPIQEHICLSKYFNLLKDFQKAIMFYKLFTNLTQ